MEWMDSRRGNIMAREFVEDIREYGLGTAWYNLRWNTAYGIAKLLIRRNIRMSVSDYVEEE